MDKQTSLETLSTTDSTESVVSSSSLPSETLLSGDSNSIAAAASADQKPKVTTVCEWNRTLDPRRQCAQCQQAVSYSFVNKQRKVEFFNHCLVRQFYCSDCGVVFPLKADYDQHFQELHHQLQASGSGSSLGSIVSSTEAAESKQTVATVDHHGADKNADKEADPQASSVKQVMMSNSSSEKIVSSSDSLAIKSHQAKVITYDWTNFPDDARRLCTLCSQQVSLALADTEAGSEFFVHCTVMQHFCPESRCGIVFCREDNYQRHYLQEHSQQAADYRRQLKVQRQEVMQMICLKQQVLQQVYDGKMEVNEKSEGKAKKRRRT